MVVILDHPALVATQAMGGNEFTALQIMDQQLIILLIDANPRPLPSHGYRVLVGLPGDQSGLVDLTRLGTHCHVQQALRDQVRSELTAFLSFEMYARLLSCCAMYADIGHRLKPVMEMMPNGFLILEAFAVQAIALDVFHSRLHL